MITFHKFFKRKTTVKKCSALQKKFRSKVKWDSEFVSDIKERDQKSGS